MYSELSGKYSQVCHTHHGPTWIESSFEKGDALAQLVGNEDKLLGFL